MWPVFSRVLKRAYRQKTLTLVTVRVVPNLPIRPHPLFGPTGPLLEIRGGVNTQPVLPPITQIDTATVVRRNSC
jgi:hypothetical protein